MNTEGKLEKVKVWVFKDQNFSEKESKIDPNPFLLPVNPESYSRSLRIVQNRDLGIGNEGTNPNFVAAEPEELRLEFIFDGTGTIQGYAYEKQPVKQQLEKFLDAVYNMNGEIHRPNFLQVQWGQFVFSGILSTLDLNYTLFEANGDPLRVKANATFVTYVAQKERTARERKTSPDLTHVRQTKAGDRLDLMTYRIYKDSKFFLQVGKANNLTSIRKLATGRDIVFPPIDKTEV